MVTTKDSENKAVAEAGLPAENKPVQRPKRTVAPARAKPKRAEPTSGSARFIGIDVRMPDKTCTDKYCPFHGTLPVRGQILEGEIVSDKMQSTVVVKREYQRKNYKYERLEKRFSRYLVHSPPCQDAQVGDHVKIMECRPLSKQVSFVIIEKTRKE